MWLGLLALAACGDDPAFAIDKLQDPSTCMDCHMEHYTQWSGSMHAYASDDPVFIAMNKRGQRDTQGKLGDFCLKCHAPMAVELKLVDDPAAFDPAALPPSARGITCYFCHNVSKVAELHNNGLVLAHDQTMRGGAKNPVSTPAHHSKYDRLMDSTTNQSEMCGSCHDIVVPPDITGAGEVALERTFAEWQGTFFSTADDPSLHNTCGSCHMRSRARDVIADKPGLDVPVRPNGFHDHRFPGVDKALTEFPELADQAAEVKKLLDQSLNIIGPVPRGGGTRVGGVCLPPSGELSVRVDSIGTGHNWPSGAAQDRRAWVEVIAYDAEVGGNVVFSRGAVPDGMDPAPDIETAQSQLFGFWDITKRADGQPAHFFWDVASVKSVLLPGPTTTDQNSPAFDHSITHTFPDARTVAAQIKRIEVRMRIRPLPFAMLDELIASGDLAPALRDKIQTIDVGKARTWLDSTKDPITRCGPP